MADRAYLVRLQKELADAGKLIEAGWAGYRLGVMSPSAPAIQLEECKLAFFAGAYHLFQSMMVIMDDDREPTDADLHKMDLIHEEMQTFAKVYELKVRKPEGSA